MGLRRCGRSKARPRYFIGPASPYKWDVTFPPFKFTRVFFLVVLKNKWLTNYFYPTFNLKLNPVIELIFSNDFLFSYLFIIILSGAFSRAVTGFCRRCTYRIVNKCQREGPNIRACYRMASGAHTLKRIKNTPLFFGTISQGSLYRSRSEGAHEKRGPDRIERKTG